MIDFNLLVKSVIQTLQRLNVPIMALPGGINNLGEFHDACDYENSVMILIADGCPLGYRDIIIYKGHDNTAKGIKLSDLEETLLSIIQTTRMIQGIPYKRMENLEGSNDYIFYL